MLRAFNRRTEYALAAYNAGPGAVTRWRQARGDLPVDIFVEEIPYRETRDYARRVLAANQTLYFIRTTREAAKAAELAAAEAEKAAAAAKGAEAAEMIEITTEAPDNRLARAED
jgi:hypothetical protein